MVHSVEPYSPQCYSVNSDQPHHNEALTLTGGIAARQDWWRRPTWYRSWCSMTRWVARCCRVASKRRISKRPWPRRTHPANATWSKPGTTSTRKLNHPATDCNRRHRWWSQFCFPVSPDSTWFYPVLSSFIKHTAMNVIQLTYFSVVLTPGSENILPEVIFWNWIYFFKSKSNSAIPENVKFFWKHSSSKNKISSQFIWSNQAMPPETIACCEPHLNLK